MHSLAEIYQSDYFAWIARNSELLRQGRFAELDRENLAEELEDMGRRQRKELVNRLVILLAHLLKWQFQPVHRSASWRGSVAEQRFQVLRELDFSPSLKPFLPEAIALAYPDAVELAMAETGLASGAFPDACPYSQAQILDKGFFPN